MILGLILAGIVLVVAVLGVAGSYVIEVALDALDEVIGYIGRRKGRGHSRCERVQESRASPTPTPPYTTLHSPTRTHTTKTRSDP